MGGIRPHYPLLALAADMLARPDKKERSLKGNHASFSFCLLDLVSLPCGVVFVWDGDA